MEGLPEDHRSRQELHLTKISWDTVWTTDWRKPRWHAERAGRNPLLECRWQMTVAHFGRRAIGLGEVETSETVFQTSEKKKQDVFLIYCTIICISRGINTHVCSDMHRAFLEG